MSQPSGNTQLATGSPDRFDLLLQRFDIDLAECPQAQQVQADLASLQANLAALEHAYAADNAIPLEQMAQVLQWVAKWHADPVTPLCFEAWLANLADRAQRQTAITPDALVALGCKTLRYVGDSGSSGAGQGAYWLPLDALSGHEDSLYFGDRRIEVEFHAPHSANHDRPFMCYLVSTSCRWALPGVATIEDFQAAARFAQQAAAEDEAPAG